MLGIWFYFWNSADWTPPVVGGQSPAATRYRTRYKVTDIIRALVAFVRF